MIQSASKILGNISEPIAIVAHDAGAANHIAAWLGGDKINSVRGSFAGPAIDIFARQCPWIPVDHLAELMPKCKTLISGTGWASAYEYFARKLGRQVGCRSIAVIDHWTNYRARFIRNGEEVLPDEIWVTDEYAKCLAETEFPGIQVVQLENSYLETLLCEVRSQETEKNKIALTKHNILYVLEPIRQAWGSNNLPGEFQALDFFVMNLGALGLNVNAPIKLRPHPSDMSGKYDQWIGSQNGLNISLDESATLAESIAWADVVVGCQTYAMVVALAARRRVISTIPFWAPQCILPQSGILKLANLVNESL